MATGADEGVPAERGAAFVAALGGAENVASIDACTTRLRLVVRDQAKVDEARLRALGAKGFVRPSADALQVVLGPIADMVAGEMRNAAASRGTVAPIATAIMPDLPSADAAPWARGARRAGEHRIRHRQSQPCHAAPCRSLADRRGGVARDRAACAGETGRRCAPPAGRRCRADRPGLDGLSDTPTATGPRDPHDRAGRRLVSLDLLRGLTVLGMIVVNATAGVAHRDGPVFPPLLHADWAGFTIADSIFPAFILMVGVSIAISSRSGVPRYRPHPDPRGAAGAARPVPVEHLLAVRHAGISCPPAGRAATDRDRLRGGGADLSRVPAGVSRAALAVVVLLGYWPLCLLPSPDGSSTDLWVQGHNFVSWFDRAVLGGTRFVLGPQGYDPEGLLSTLPTIAEALIGTLAGDFLRRGLPPREASRAMALAGAAILVAGVGWSFVFPIAKNMWSSSFVLVSAGIALLALAGFHLGFDRDDAPVRRGGVLGSFGRNAIAAYALHEMTAFILTSDALQWPYHQLAPVTGTRIAALAPVLIFTGLVWWPIAAMDRRGWYLKI